MPPKRRAVRQRSRSTSSRAESQTRMSHTQPGRLQRALSDPSILTPHQIRHLQRTYGNQATSQLVAGDGAESVERSPVSVTPAPRAVVQRREEDEIHDDLTEMRRRLGTIYLRPTYGALDDAIDLLLDLKEEADGEGYADVVRQIDTQLGRLAGMIAERLYLPNGDNRQALLRRISHGIGISTAEFSDMSVGLYAPAIGGKTRGGEFAHPGMQEAERAERRRLRGEHGLEEGTGERDDKAPDEPDFEVPVRVNLLAQAMKVAYQGYLRENATRGDVLPVFQAPEWFFRRPDRPYTPAEKNAVVAMLAERSANYPNLMIVGGTILWAQGLDNPGAGGENIKVYNSAPVIMNGQVIRLYDKKNEGGDIAGYEHLNIGMANWTPGEASNLFSVSNVNFAIDVCADTTDGKAKREYYARTAEGRSGGAGVDVHLITANSSGAANTVERPGGYVLRTDSAYATQAGTQAPAHPDPVGTTEIRQPAEAPPDMPLLSDSTTPGRDVSPEQGGIYRGTVPLPGPSNLEEEVGAVNREADMIASDLTSEYQNLRQEAQQFGQPGRDARRDLVTILAWARAHQPPRIANTLMHTILKHKASQLVDQNIIVTGPTGAARMVPLKRLGTYVLTQLDRVNTAFDPREADRMAQELDGYQSLKAKVAATKNGYTANQPLYPEQQEQLINMLAYVLYHHRKGKKGRAGRVQGMKNRVAQIITENNRDLGPNLELAVYVQQRLGQVRTKR